MGGKAILILLLVATALGVMLYFTRAKPPVETVAETSVLDGRSLTDAKRIRWQFHDRPAVELGRAPDGRFQIEEPIVDIASAGYMRQIVHSWDSANMRQVPFADDESGREKAGLTTPELVFIVEWEDGKRLEIEVGAPGPLGPTRFLRRDERIWEGGAALLESLRVSLSDLRERSVFRHSFQNAQEVRVEQLLPSGKRESLHLKMQGAADRQGAEWQLLSPVTGRADPAAAQRFVTAVLALRADNFQLGIVRQPDREPDIRINVNGAYGEEAVDLWLEEGQVWGRLPARGHIFSSDNRQYTQIFRNAANHLRARILVPMGESTFEQLVELIIDPGQGRGARIRMMRKSQNSPWQMIEPIEYAVRATPINEAAHALHSLVAREFVSEDGVRPRANDPRYGLQGARWTVATRRVRKVNVNTLWFGSDVPSGDAPGSGAIGGPEALVYCCRSDEPDNVALVPKLSLETLQRSWLVYLDKQIVKQPQVVERIDLKHADGRQRSFLMVGEHWQQKGVEGERDEVGNLVNDDLRDFFGKNAVDMRKDHGADFGEHDWELVLMRREGDGLGSIKFWDRGEEHLLIAKGHSEQPVGFEVNARNSRDLRALWK